MAALDAPLRAMTGYRLRRTTTSVMSRLNCVFAEFDLRHTTYATLAIVIESPGLRQGKVAEALAIERPNFVQIVDELEEAGLLTREPALHDKRAYALIATSKGKAVFQTAARAAHAFEESLVKGLSEAQVSALFSALETISENLDDQETENGQ